MEVIAPASGIKKATTYGGDVFIGGPRSGGVNVQQLKLESDLPSVALIVGPADVTIMVTGNRGDRLDVTFR